MHPDDTIAIDLAAETDAKALATISKRAFESNIDYGSPYPDGPHGYASPAWQRDMMRCACGYWKILRGTDLIGGAIVLHRLRGRFHLARIYIDPDFHRRGYGRKAIHHVLAVYPEARRWTLETPAWNQRARTFYDSVGFRPIRRQEEMIVCLLIPDAAAIEATRSAPDQATTAR